MRKNKLFVLRSVDTITKTTSIKYYTVGNGNKTPSVMAFVELPGMKQFHRMVCDVGLDNNWNIKHIARDVLYKDCCLKGLNILVYTKTKKWVKLYQEDDKTIIEVI